MNGNGVAAEEFHGMFARCLDCGNMVNRDSVPLWSHCCPAIPPRRTWSWDISPFTSAAMLFPGLPVEAFARFAVQCAACDAVFLESRFEGHYCPNRPAAPRSSSGH